MSETTVVKGQFGLDQSGGTGKKLKIFYFTEMNNWQNPTLGPRAQQIQWINLIFTSHDMICGCNDTWKHLKTLLEDHQVQCHFGGPAATAGTQDDKENGDPLESGDLELLFKEDFDEEPR